MGKDSWWRLWLGLLEWALVSGGETPEEELGRDERDNG